MKEAVDSIVHFGCSESSSNKGVPGLVPQLASGVFVYDLQSARQAHHERRAQCDVTRQSIKPAESSQAEEGGKGLQLGQAVSTCNLVLSVCLPVSPLAHLYAATLGHLT